MNEHTRLHLKGEKMDFYYSLPRVESAFGFGVLKQLGQ